MELKKFRYSAVPALLLALVSAAQAEPRTVYFWSSAVGSQGLRAGVDNATLGTWGNGKHQEARRVRYEGAPTLQITTRNFREGVRFDLKAPLDIEPYRESGYLRFRLRFQETAPRVTTPVGTPGVGVPGQPPMPGAMPAPGAMPGAPGGFGGGVIANPTYQSNFQLGPLPPLGAMGGLPGGGIEPVVTGPTPQRTELTELLCTLVLDNGVMEGTITIPKQWDNPDLIDFDKVRPDANGWMLFVLPIKQMRSTPGASGMVRRMILTGDREDTFYMTQAALVVETEEMQVLIRRPSDPPGAQISEITVKPGPVTLVAEVEAGAADPAIEWNFDADNIGNLPPPKIEGAAPAAPAEGAPDMLPGLPGAGIVLPGRPLPGGVAPGEGEAAPVVGPRIDARGLVARFEYPNEEQNYRVEVTVRDRSGKKEPATASILVRVRG